MDINFKRQLQSRCLRYHKTLVVLDYFKRLHNKRAMSVLYSILIFLNDFDNFFFKSMLCYQKKFSGHKYWVGGWLIRLDVVIILRYITDFRNTFRKCGTDHRIKSKKKTILNTQFITLHWIALHNIVFLLEIY